MSPTEQNRRRVRADWNDRFRHDFGPSEGIPQRPLKNGRRSAIDKRTTRRPRHAAGQRIRKRIKEAFGWIKTVGGRRQTKLRGLARVGLGLHLRHRRRSGAGRHPFYWAAARIG
jgi:hypothetical protein